MNSFLRPLTIVGSHHRCIRGDGRDGALGHGTSVVCRTPLVVAALKDENICAIAAGWKLTLYVNGELLFLLFTPHFDAGTRKWPSVSKWEIV